MKQLVYIFLFLLLGSQAGGETVGSEQTSCPACVCDISDLKSRKIACEEIQKIKNNSTSNKTRNAFEAVLSEMKCEQKKNCPDTHYQAASGICVPK